jgi:DNA invertase Pin-like site-specific DNA recombinase
VKRAALYLRVSTVDQHPETQLHDLRGLAAQRGFQIVQEYTDRLSGVKARRPGLDQLLADVRRGKVDVVMVWAFDRLARSTRHFLEVLDELSHLNVEFISFRENVDTSGPLGRAITVIIGCVAELERNLIIERVRAGMRRAKLEGRRIGREPLDVDRLAVVRDRARGLSLAELAKQYRVSRSSICRVLRDAQSEPVSKGVVSEPTQLAENRPPKSAA